MGSSQVDKLADAYEETWTNGDRLSVDEFLTAQDLVDLNSEQLSELRGELSVLEKELSAKYEANRILGNYELLEEIGRGGMGILYKARHLLLHKTVAVKLLPKKIATDPIAVKRFEREMKIIGKLSSPYIVQAFGAEKVGDSLLLAMEFVYGRNLLEIVSTEGKIPLEKALQIVKQVAIGLQHANEYGVLHRDIKPANIMLSETGDAKILDFGLGKLLDEQFAQPIIGTDSARSQLTVLGSPLGTLDFLAPEQWDSPGNVDIRADIYGLGCTFFFIVTGNVPYPTEKYGSIRQMMVAHTLRPFPKLSENGISAAPVVEKLLARMTAKDLTRRLSNPQEVVDAVDAILSFDAPKKTRNVTEFWKKIIVPTTVILAFFVGWSLYRQPSAFEHDKTLLENSNVVSIPEAQLPISAEPLPATNPVLAQALASRYSGDFRTARRLNRELIDELGGKNSNGGKNANLMVTACEQLADCTLYSGNCHDPSYEFYVEEAKELYQHALSLTENKEERQIIRSKLVMLELISNQYLEGLRELEAGYEDFSSIDGWLDMETGKISSGCVFYETAKGLERFYGLETKQRRQNALRLLLDTYRLSSPTIGNAELHLERLDLQLLSISQLVKENIELGEMETAALDTAKYLDPVLSTALTKNNGLRPYLRQYFNLAIRANNHDPTKMAEYIYLLRNDQNRREGYAQLIFYFSADEQFALFIPRDLQNGKRYELSFNRSNILDLRHHKKQSSEKSEGEDNKQPFTLDSELVAAVDNELSAGRKIALSWDETACFGNPSDAIRSDVWPFYPQISIEKLSGIEK